MNIKNWDLGQIWKNKEQIIEGFKNNIFKKEHIEEIASKRLEICRSNECKAYDKNGTSEKVYMNGHESCADCGCVLSTKVRCLSCKCPLNFWKAITDEDTNTKIHEKIENS